MKLDEYKIIVKKNSYKENKRKNMFLAFISGGVISVIGELIFLCLNNILKINIMDSYALVTIIFVIIASLLTGFCVFDKIAEIFKAGILVPTTGFAHTMTSSAMDNKDEGLVFGIGSGIFKLTGSVILYGIVSAMVFALVRGLLY